MRSATGILLTAAGLLAAGNSAQAQPVLVIQAPAGQAYTIMSNAPATAVNAVTYQWYRNNVAIPGATGLNYTVPAAYAYGDNIQFYRLASTVDCTGEVEKRSNIVTITFTGYTNSDGCSLVIGGTCWADYNIDATQTFAMRADMYTRYYQWNKVTAYSAADPISPAWDATVNSADAWTVNPCPPGWRLPIQAEFELLINSGSTWVDANSGRGNVVPGRFYGYNNTACTLPTSMYGCVFLAAGGFRGADDHGALSTVGTAGFLWSSTALGSIMSGYRLRFTNSVDFTTTSGNNQGLGFNIRCVK